MTLAGVAIPLLHTQSAVVTHSDLLALSTWLCIARTNRHPFHATPCPLRLNSTTRARRRPDPRGPARTRTDFVGDPHGPNGVSRRPRPQKSPRGSGRARVVEFSYYSTYIYVGLSLLNTSVLPTYLLRLRCFQLICRYICDPSVCPSASTLLLAQSGALSRYAYYHTLIRNSGVENGGQGGIQLGPGAHRAEAGSQIMQRKSS